MQGQQLLGMAQAGGAARGQQNGGRSDTGSGSHGCIGLSMRGRAAECLPAAAIKVGMNLGNNRQSNGFGQFGADVQAGRAMHRPARRAQSFEQRRRRAAGPSKPI